MYRILLIEDDADIRNMITNYFKIKGNDIAIIDTASNGQKGLEKAYEQRYDLLFLDIMLPEVDGFEICKEVRRYSDIPIMFITARTGQDDILKGYALGCDDYIVKPFSLPVFYEKSMALIRRSKGLVRYDILKAGDVTLNPNKGIVKVFSEEITLASKEYEILKLLIENKNSVVSRDEILDKVWGYDNSGDIRILDNHIKKLRKSLNKSSAIIKTVVRRGYRLEVEEWEKSLQDCVQ